MRPNDPSIDQIVSLVVDRLKKEGIGASKGAVAAALAAPQVRVRRRGVFDDVDQAFSAARKAFEQYEAMPLETRRNVVRAIRSACLPLIDEMSHRAVTETKMGRVEDKKLKNKLAITKTPGPEFLEPIAFTGDSGLALLERAPFGVIAAITPCTNVSETIINNAIGMVAGGNAVVFNVHPLAKETSAWLISILCDAAVSAGAPENLICCVAEPSIASAQAAMRHKLARIVVVTGGGAVVQEAMRSGKRAISAGPGNPPAIVDETADLTDAARGIIAGASFDNNIICTCEKEIVAVGSILDKLRAEMKKSNAYELSSGEVRQLEKTILTSDNHISRDFVGRNAAVLLRSIGKSAGDDLRLLFAELPEDHPFVQHELLMPVLGIVRAKDVDDAIAIAKRVEHGYGHTATMWSTNVDNLSKGARAMNTSIFVKNGPNFAGIGFGGEGYTSFTISSPTGEGLTTCRTFTRERRCTMKDAFRIV
jgi:acyl-CoA reductase-like NAD-dependent aldehyde dehydrogenase